MLVLSRESRCRRSRKPLKPELNSSYHHGCDIRTLEEDVEESFREEREGEEFIALELPMEFVDPSETKGTEWLREQLDPKFSDKEEERNENARKLAQKMGEFWDGLQTSKERKEGRLSTLSRRWNEIQILAALLQLHTQSNASRRLKRNKICWNRMVRLSRLVKIFWKMVHLPT